MALCKVGYKYFSVLYKFALSFTYLFKTLRFIINYEVQYRKFKKMMKRRLKYRLRL